MEVDPQNIQSLMTMTIETHGDARGSSVTIQISTFMGVSSSSWGYPKLAG